MNKTIWKEIRCDFFNEDEGDVCICAWYTDDTDESGEVIARVDANANVVYLEDMAKDDPLVQEAIKTARFDALARKAYPLYINQWCAERGYNPDDRDDENGFGGEDYVCFREFEDCEFCDEEYVKTLLSEDDFKIYQEL